MTDPQPTADNTGAVPADPQQEPAPQEQAPAEPAPGNDANAPADAPANEPSPDTDADPAGSPQPAPAAGDDDQTDTAPDSTLKDQEDAAVSDVESEAAAVLEHIERFSAKLMTLVKIESKELMEAMRVLGTAAYHLKKHIKRHEKAAA